MEKFNFLPAFVSRAAFYSSTSARTANRVHVRTFDFASIARSLPPVLGLDVNTKTTGFGVLANGKFQHCGVIKTPQESTIQKTLEIQRNLLALKELNVNGDKNWLVGIETPLKNFARRALHLSVLFDLNRLNAMIAFACYELFDNEPKLVNALTARSFLGLVTSNKTATRKDSKQRVFNTLKCAVEASGYEWIQKKGNRGYSEISFDVTDASLIALFVYKEKMCEAILSSSSFVEEGAMHERNQVTAVVEKSVRNHIFEDILNIKP